MASGDRAPRQNSGAWASWVAFAGIMLALIGFFDILQGVTALTDDGYFVAAGGDLLVFDFTTWGWILLIWGALLVLGGFGLLSGKSWSRWLAIVLIFVNTIAQVGFLASYPIWSAILIALDVVVLYALTARWDEASAGLSA